MARFFRRRKFCRFTAENVKEIDYKDLEYLRKNISAQGQIVSRRKTALCSRCQRNLKRAIKRARFLALVPYLG